MKSAQALKESDSASPTSDCCIFLAGSVTHNWDYVVQGMQVTIRSCLATNPNIPIFALVDDDSEKIRQALKGCQLIKIDASKMEDSIREDLSKGAYFRFFVHELKEYRKALYLDGDTVVLGDLSPLFEISGEFLVRRMRRHVSVDFRNPETVMNRENVSEEVLAMNNGVILFDMEYWSDGRILEDFMAIADEYGWKAFKNPAQGFSNIICWRRGIEDRLPAIYNTFADEIEKASDFESKIDENGISYPCISGRDIKIIHFIGPIKPWHFAREGYIPAARRCFRYYAQFLPWHRRLRQHVSAYPNFLIRKFRSLFS